jgi:hypothetical protein
VTFLCKFTPLFLLNLTDHPDVVWILKLTSLVGLRPQAAPLHLLSAVM